MDRARDSISRIVPCPEQRGQTTPLVFTQRRAQTLTGHFQQAKTGDTTGLNPGAVHGQGLTNTVLNLALVAVVTHVDKVDHDQAADVAQAQLAGDFVSGFQVGV